MTSVSSLSRALPRLITFASPLLIAPAPALCAAEPASPPSHAQPGDAVASDFPSPPAPPAARRSTFSFNRTTDLDSLDSLMMETTVVTTHGSQRVLVVTETDLNLRQANDLEDALSIDPSVTVGGSIGIAQKIYVRNLGEGLLNVSVDGATQAGFLYAHVGRNLIEPELLKQVEIQPGVGNAADGPGALGGAIRFITKDPDDFLKPGETAGAVVRQGYFSNTDGLKSSVTGFGRANAIWSGLVSVVYVDHNEIEDGDGNTLVGSDSQQQAVLAKAVGTFSNGQSLRVSFENIQEEGNKLRRPEWIPSPGNPRYYMEAERSTATLGYGIRPETIEWVDLHLNLSYTRAELMQDGAFGPYNGAIESLQLDLRNRHRFADHLLVYGLDHRRDVVNAGPTWDPKRFEENGAVTGAFIQGDLALTDRLTAHAGSRFDVFRLEDRSGQTFNHQGFSPNLGATCALTRELSLHSGVAASYRGAHIHDSYRIDLSQNDPDIDAEKAINYETRLLYQRPKFSVEVGAYLHRIDDVITNTLPWTTTYTNAGRVETTGAFARASYEIGQVVLGVQYNHADTTIADQTATRYQYSSLLSRVGDTWVGDVLWRPIDQLDLGWNARLVQGVDDIRIPSSVTDPAPGPYSINKPGYITHDVYLRWRPTFAKALTVNLTVKNVFDKHYRSHGSVEDLTAIPGFAGVVGSPEPGRDIRLSVSLRF